jgi:hypothetical protein
MRLMRACTLRTCVPPRVAANQDSYRDSDSQPQPHVSGGDSDSGAKAGPERDSNNDLHRLHVEPR